MLVFGDSLSDTGNVFQLTNGADVGLPNFAGRYSDGPVWVEQLATRLGVGSPEPSLLGGTNFAYGRAQTGHGTDTNEYGTEIPRLGNQIDSYLANEPQIAPSDLVVVWIGHNDRTHFVADRTILTNLSEHLATLHAHGAQHVLVPNLIVPPAIVFASQQSAADSALNFNRMMNAYLGRVDQQYELDIYRLDMTPVWNDLYVSGDLVLDAAYDVTSATVDPEPERFIWWDNKSWHPSSTTHDILAEAAYTLLLDGPTDFPFGDVDGDFNITVPDIDRICRNTRRRYDPLYDLNDDDRVSIEDVAVFLSQHNSQPGDANLDGATDFSDFVILSSSFATKTGSWSNGDFDCNRTVDFNDFLILSDHFGDSMADDVATVPEPPASSTLLGLLASLFWRYRNRVKRKLRQAGFRSRIENSHKKASADSDR